MRFIGFVKENVFGGSGGLVFFFTTLLLLFEIPSPLSRFETFSIPDFEVEPEQHDVKNFLIPSFEASTSSV